MTAQERRHSGQDRYRKVLLMMNVNMAVDVQVPPEYGRVHASVSNSSGAMD